MSARTARPQPGTGGTSEGRETLRDHGNRSRRHSVPPRPEWCGLCRQTDRLVEDAEGRPSRCTRCHPRVVAQREADAGESRPPALPSPQRSTHRPRSVPAASQLADYEAPSSEQCKREADRIIRHLATTRKTFSANHMRPLWEAAQIPHATRGPRVGAAVVAGLIVHVGWERSTDPGTHGKEVKVYRAGPALRADR